MIVVRLHRGRSRARFLTGLLITLGTGLMLGRVPPPGPAVSFDQPRAPGVASEISAASTDGLAPTASSSNRDAARAR